jgi:hypothetical protein
VEEIFIAPTTLYGHCEKTPKSRDVPKTSDLYHKSNMLT